MLAKTNWFKKKKIERAEARERKKEQKERRQWEEQEVDRDSGAGNKEDIEVKAVIQVPFTWNSILVKKSREGEKQMERTCGNRIKFEERAGPQLARMLVKNDPWEGKDCEM